MTPDQSLELTFNHAVSFTVNFNHMRPSLRNSSLAVALACVISSTCAVPAVAANHSEPSDQAAAFSAAAATNSSSNALAHTTQPQLLAANHADEVYSGRQGNFDVSVVIDSQGQHKFSPEQESQRQIELQQRHAQERATAEALANPQTSDQYIQGRTNAPNLSTKEGSNVGTTTNTAPQAQLANSKAPTPASSALGSQGDLWADMLDPSQPIDMTLGEQTLQLNILNSKTAPAPFTQLVIDLEHPTQLKESFILAGDKYVLSYSETSGAFAITFTLSALTPEQDQDFQKIDNLKTALTQRFHDKEKLLYGEYTIVNELDLPAHKELTLKGFLKKPEDGILPDMQNYFYERTVIDKGYIATISCEFRGSQVQAAHTSTRFDVLEQLCQRIVDGYRYEFKTNPN